MKVFRSPATYFLSATFLFVAWSFSIYFTSAPILSLDLPGHISIIERLLAQIWQGHVSFFDPFWFSGWPAFQFYGFFAHLVTAIFSIPISVFSSEPVRLAVHLVLVFGTASLPITFYYAALPLAREIRGKSELSAEERGFLAIFVCALTLWFINHDDGNLGLGAAAPMLTGTYAQLWAWHLALLHIGALFRVLQRGARSDYCLLSLSFAMLLATHPLTAFFSAFYAALAICGFGKQRWALIGAHLLAVGLIAWWLFPLLGLIKEYTMLTVLEPRGDIFQIFLRHPLSEMLQALVSWVKGNIVPFDPTPLVIIFLALSALAHPGMKQSKITLRFFVFSLLGIIVFASSFIASTLGLGLHYYRFLPHAVLILILLLAPLSLLYLKEGNSLWARTLRIYLCCLVGLSLCGSLLLPSQHFIRLKRIDSVSYFAAQEQVLSYLRENRQNIGRVFFEHVDRGPGIIFPTPHYMPSRLGKESGLETVNGLFVESSISSVLVNISAGVLKAETYKTDIPLDPVLIDISPEQALQQLQDFGISEIVAVHDALLATLRELGLVEAVVFPPYHIFTLPVTKFALAREVDGPVIGYWDISGRLPFKIVESVFHSRSALFGNELIELFTEIPNGVSLAVVHGSAAQFAKIKERNRGKTKLIHLPEIETQKIDHYAPAEHGDFVRYFALQKQLASGWENEFTSQVESLPVLNSFGKEASLHWGPASQNITLTGLNAGRFVRLNYTYFPYWMSLDGQVFRGSAERIFLLPNKEEAELVYTRWRSIIALFGAIVSILALAIAAIVYRENVITTENL